ncbi:MAG: hypothetical protein CL666_15345 [Balneola sp.]|nr:hypothetical protein [Balneola sp.]
MKKKVFGTILFALILFVGNSSAYMCDPMDVYLNCAITADEQYQNGTYSWELYQAFLNDYCVDAANSCG